MDPAVFVGTVLFFKVGQVNSNPYELEHPLCKGGLYFLASEAQENKGGI